MSAKTAVVTGGAGFIGSHVVRGLLAEGYKVRVIDDLSTGSIQNLESLRDNVDLIEADLAGDPDLAASLKGARFVFHQAAIPSVARSTADPIRSHRANVTATINLLLSSREARVPRVIYASTAAVYGGGTRLPIDESQPSRPQSIYAATKLAGENYCLVFTKSFGLPAIALRYFNIFGPRQDPQSEYSAAIPKFALALLRGESIAIFGDGKQSRDFTFVEDVVQANLRAASASPDAIGRAFNVGRGEERTILDLVDVLGGLTGSDVRISWAPPRPGDIRHSRADIHAARKFLGYEPVVAFEEGLRRTVEWLRDTVDLKEAGGRDRSAVDTEAR